LIKKRIVESDEKEIFLRKILNFGHTFAHAYEATLNYSKKLNHGEAVILGIKIASKFSLSNKLLNIKEFQLIENHINKLNLNYDANKLFSKKDINKILFFMIKDKKNVTGKINLILLKKIGNPSYNLQFTKKKIKSFLIEELT
jgi:3-dehydroquinate synthase/shikimate kinase/3-dehydroquinate synthase